MFEKYFHLKANGTTMRTEILAGITTFLTMAYILAVNPNILAATGMDKGALFTATAVASIVGTLAMSLLAKLPFAQAPGMGMNAFLLSRFAWVWVIPGSLHLRQSWLKV